MRASTSWKYLAIYYSIACGIAWGFWATIILGQDGLRWLPIAPSPPVLLSLGTLGPLLGCFVSHRLQSGNWRAVRLFPQPGLRLLWLLFGPMLIIFCFLFISPALGAKGAPNSWHWHFNVFPELWGVMLSYSLPGGPLCEEFGWRGFLQARLQESLPPWIAAIVVAIMWVAWHWPLFFLPGWSTATPTVFLFILTGLSVVMAFAFNASGKSVVVAILMHSGFNTSGMFGDRFTAGTPMHEHPSPELFIGLAFWLVGIGLVLVTRGHLSAPKQKPLSFPRGRETGPGSPS
jgi:membrane protease YdiL (CAAX protease family)